MNHVDRKSAPRRPNGGRRAEALILDAARQSIVVDFVAHLRSGSGLMALLGRPGSGRSTLLQRVASEAAAEQLPLLAPLDDAAPMSALVDAIGQLTTQAAASLVRNRRAPGMLIDDAEACPVAVWHKLAGLLRNRPAASSPPPAIILALPPEMLHWLKDLALIEPAVLTTRVRRLDPFPPAEAGLFVAQRLEAAGHMPPGHTLPIDMTERIAEATGGMPGPLDGFCDAVVGLTRLRGGGWVSMEIIEMALAAAAGSPLPPLPGEESQTEVIAVGDAPAAIAPAAATFTAPPLTALPPEPAVKREPVAARPSAADELPIRPPLFADEVRGGTLFQSTRRRRWPWIVGGGAAALVALAVAGALYVPTNDEAGPVVSRSAPETPAMVPSLAERLNAMPATAPISPTPPAAPAAEAVPATMPAAGPGRGTDTSLRASPAASPNVGNEEPPVVFAPVSPVSRPVEASQPVPPPSANAKAVANTAPPADAATKRPAAGNQPASPPRAAASSARTGTEKRERATATAEPAPARAAAEAPATGEEPLTPPRSANELIEIGDDFRGAGDMAWARKYYEAAQKQGSGKATRALAETYDPRLVNGSDRPDPTRARELYDQAAQKGDRGAVKERETLEQWLNGGQ